MKISVVIPLYNECEVFPHLIKDLKALQKQEKFTWEFILVDDGSHDGTSGKIRDICHNEHNFKAVLLSRNFGHQNAVSAGLLQASGDWVAIIDGDLQDPPALIPVMQEQASTQDIDVLYAVRRERKESIFKVFCYWAFYRLLAISSTVKIPLDSGDFCIMRRCVVDVINSMPETNRFIRGLRAYAGFRQEPYYYERQARQSGKPKYTFHKLIGLALNGFFTFSEIPLRLSTWLGLAIATFSLFYFLYTLLWLFIGDKTSPGILSIVAGLFLLGGVQLICFGIMGEYIARIHDQVKKRPQHIIAEKINFTTKV